MIWDSLEHTCQGHGFQLPNSLFKKDYIEIQKRTVIFTSAFFIS
ncbi:hypothetical protein J2S10_002979 [Neobacillus ginsengisoli]|uniref:Uncharacterized protein n=1 Tax=Neobacillus ginsengisoli TaxID=904295 RepID=A0ABT9XY19_9BACI|nr:hypothetical protein [Neobacillus ginsengisoli]